MKIESCAHIPGKLYPVNMPLLKNKPNLYIENERVLLRCRDRAGKIHYMVLVGALNVGRMVLTFEKRVNTNRGSGAERLYFDYEEPIEMKKGELFGWFEMGSTIVVLSEAEALKYTVDIGEKVSFSQSIGSLKD
jgi:phosphatidylserine decarboxylase